jgi:hypothetical protein
MIVGLPKLVKMAEKIGCKEWCQRFDRSSHSPIDQASASCSYNNICFLSVGFHFAALQVAVS